MSINESLNSNSNYPIMTQSQWDNAPFNQEDLPEKQFEAFISCSLSKDITISSNDYNPNGKYGNEELNNPVNAYRENHYTILELLDILSDVAKMKLIDNKNHSKYYLDEWTQILNDCSGWVVDDEIVEQQ